MTAHEIKQNLHSLIEKIDDNLTLEEIQDIVTNIVDDKKLTWSSLSEAERKAIESGLEDAENGRIIDYDDLKAKYPEWFGK